VRIHTCVETSCNMHSICTLGLISSLHIFLRGGQKSRTPPRNESASRQKYEGTARRGRGLPLKSPRSLRLHLGAISRGDIARWLSVSCTLVGCTVIGGGLLATLMTFHRIIRWTEERYRVLARRARQRRNGAPYLVVCRGRAGNEGKKKRPNPSFAA